MSEQTAELTPLQAWTNEPFLSFDIAGPGLESVDVRPSRVVAVETDAKYPGTCVLRITPGIWYRVEGEADDVIAALGADDE